MVDDGTNNRRGDDFLRNIAHQDEGIAAEATDESGDHIFACALDIERIVTFHTIGFKGFFGSFNDDVKTGAGNPVAGHDKDVIKF